MVDSLFLIPGLRSANVFVIMNTRFDMKLAGMVSRKYAERSCRAYWPRNLSHSAPTEQDGRKNVQ